MKIILKFRFLVKISSFYLERLFALERKFFGARPEIRSRSTTLDLSKAFISLKILHIWIGNLFEIFDGQDFNKEGAWVICEPSFTGSREISEL